MRMTTGTKEQRAASYRLAAETDSDPRTALAWLMGRTVKGAIGYGLAAAFKTLGLDASLREAG